MLKDYFNKQAEIESNRLAYLAAEEALKEARYNYTHSKTLFKNYCRKQLKECVKAGYLEVDPESNFKGHFRIPKSSVHLCMADNSTNIKVYDYDRNDWYSLDLEKIQTGMSNLTGVNVWEHVLDARERGVLKDIISLMSC